ncbi:MAG: hypothetical protein IT210_17500 [Armatimonadetes bacterium]|nr:hypothetical protein [Armatimonadota bacterium]
MSRCKEPGLCQLLARVCVLKITTGVLHFYDIGLTLWRNLRRRRSWQ